MPTNLELAPEQGTTAQQVFQNQAEIERFWQDLYAKVKDDLARWEDARSKSEEDARNLWLRQGVVA
ncbi:MAG: hypothetical protein QM691_12765 [Opitutaceae bacterium]